MAWSASQCGSLPRERMVATAELYSKPPAGCRRYEKRSLFAAVLNIAVAVGNAGILSALFSDSDTTEISRNNFTALRSGRATCRRRPGRRCAMLRFEPGSGASFQPRATSKPLERFLESRQRRAYRSAY